MGMTGIGFHFIVDKTACASSATVYEWVSEHFSAMDRIGIHSDFYSITDDPGLNTMGMMREDAVKRIKESIDNGIAVVIWAPTYVLEYGIILGYDDDDGVFFVESCMPQNPDPILYSNLGKSDVPMLSYQIFKGKVNVDREKIFRDSLQFGPRTVDVHVRRLREQIEEQPDNPRFLTTVRGFGYRFEEDA
jgi:hypothetical protein